MERIPHLRRWVVGAVIVGVLVVATGASARPEGTVVLRIATNGVVTGSHQLRCQGRCWLPFERGALVTLHAAPPKHFQFDGWSGGCVGVAPTCVLSLDESASVRARFVGELTSVFLSVGGPGTIVSSPQGLACGGGRDTCEAEFPWGTRLRLSARPRTDGALAAWGSSCWNVGLGSCTLTLGRDETNVSAAFRHAVPLPGLQTLTVIRRAGSVTSKPAGIHCPDVCTASFPSGTRVRLETAGRWEGACASVALSPCLLVLDAPTTVIASPPLPHVAPASNDVAMRVSVSGRGQVTAPGIKCDGVSGTLSDCDNFFAPKTAVTLTAKAAKKGHFLGWDLFCKNWGTKPKCNLFLSTSSIVAARFKL